MPQTQIKESYKIIEGDNGAIRGITGKIQSTNMDARQFAGMLRRMPEVQRKRFMRECRIVSVLPMYMPDGDFKEDVNALNIDPDQIKWFQKNRPDFNC